MRRELNAPCERPHARRTMCAMKIAMKILGLVDGLPVK
jgi:hypothetical protein